MERKSPKEYSVVSFWWKVKSSSYTKFAFEEFLFVVGYAATSVGTTLEFAAFRNGPDAKYSRGTAFLFFSVHNQGFVAVRTHFPKNTPASLVDRAAINKQLFIEMYFGKGL